MWRRLLGRWRSLSIRWQMTALVTGLIAVTLSTFAVFLDVRFARETFTARAELLHRVADPMLAADLAETSAGADTDTVVLHRVAVDLANAFDDGSGRFARVADMDGVLVPFDPAETGSATAKSGPSAMDPTVLARAAARSTETIITRAEANQLAGDERFSYVVLLVPLASHGRSIGVAVLGDVVGPRDGLTSTIQITFLGVAVGAVVAALVARLLISAALRPLVQIAHATRRVASGDWEIRVSSRPSSAELDELAQAFDRMLEQLQGVFEAHRQFVADASHELRSPLTAIGGMLEMLQLQAERGDPTARERIESALIRETERLTRLVEDLLTLSQVERDGRPNELVQLDTVMTELRPMLDALTQGHELHLALGPVPPVLGQRSRLQQMAINLVENAGKYTPVGGRIQVEVGAEAGHVVLRVSDTGVGMPPDALPRIFERFYRADTSRARRSGGAGLGLALVQAIVTAHRGTVEVTSRVGQGTTFTVRLPAMVVEAA